MNQSLVINLGTTEQIPIGQGACFVIEEQEIAVFRLRNGDLLAVENRCPHRGGPLAEGIVGAGKVICPLHGHKFDLSTGKGNETHECVKVYQVWEENNRIMLNWIPSRMKEEVKECVVS